MAATVKVLIKRDLMEQLELKGELLKYHEDLIEDYLSYFEIKKQLIKDIKKRGVSVETEKGAKKNESISELNKTTQIMLKILNELGLKPPEIKTVNQSQNADLL